MTLTEQWTTIETFFSITFYTIFLILWVTIFYEKGHHRYKHDHIV